jgi:transcriptional regulator with PAS, ATPase and Fis domain
MDGEAHYTFLGMPAIIASPAMAKVVETARRLGGNSIAVLITGETGTGKEIVARAIHHHSLRCNGPWVDINCGALPDHLIESELFGHEKGAFSGADSTKAGLFELAHRGTLFLDEVGELDARMQVKLLRVLDGVPYYRVGGQKKIAADVRVIAATNQDLEQRMAAGRFRSDLYHRLNQFRIRVPPLRERLEDIVPLAEYFLGQHSEKAVLSDEAKAALRRYAWPGNVRELRNAVTHAVISARTYAIGVEDLPPFENRVVESATESGPLRLDGVERETILDALERTAGHQQRAADLLGISRRTLSRKLKSYRTSAGESLFAAQPVPPS